MSPYPAPQIPTTVTQIVQTNRAILSSKDYLVLLVSIPSILFIITLIITQQHFSMIVRWELFYLAWRIISILLVLRIISCLDVFSFSLYLASFTINHFLLSLLALFLELSYAFLGQINLLIYWVSCQLIIVILPRWIRLKFPLICFNLFLLLISLFLSIICPILWG